MLDRAFQARYAALRDDIRARHAAGKAGAGMFRRLAIRFQIHRELSREWKQIAPSFQSLY
jgi:hypothetical protein